MARSASALSEQLAVVAQRLVEPQQQMVEPGVVAHVVTTGQGPAQPHLQ